MADTLSASIRKYAQECGFDEDVITNVIKQSLRTAYKKQYGTDENLDFETEDDGEIYMVSRKVVVEKEEDPVFEISLKKALAFDPESAIGDELRVIEDVQTYRFHAVQAGKQRVQQCLKEVQKDELYSEYNSKVGEIIIGYYRRENNGNIYVDLGKVEGVLPKKYRSPRDHYSHEENRIKALIKEVKKLKQSNTVQLVLSRSDSDFVRGILELEVPEIYNDAVEIKNIVREAGSRTKVAVSSNKIDVDPVGACIGPRGARIQTVITELDGEKIDVIPYSENPKDYIKAALSPAEVEDVIIMDESTHSALAIVEENQLSLAIGKQGLNVRLANRLVDWNIDVKTEEQFKEMDSYKEVRKAADDLFADADELETEYEETDDTDSAELALSDEMLSVLRANGIEEPSDILDMTEQQLAALNGMTDSMLNEMLQIVSEYIDNEEYYECPECGHRITIDMTVCPNCGVGLSFEEEEDEEAEDDYDEE